MAQLMSVKLSRYDNSPWGFRLQGGKDFGTPLVIQKVNGGSLAEKAGLQAGDAVLRINNVDATALRHKDAQDVIVRAGNAFELAVQRGGMGTWKPHVTPVGPSPVKPSSGNVTKTSLAYKGPAPAPIGTGHNVSAKPFGTIAHMNGGPEKTIVNKQYNSPAAIYSEESIAETLSAQAEVLSGGAIGVNFQKNEKKYNAANSEVFKMVQEADKEPRLPEPDAVPVPAAVPAPVPGGVPTPFGVHGLRHVQAPEHKEPAAQQDPFKVLPPGQNICAECERLIVGVFVRIKDKNLHVECFKCATCGTPLKNVGYYNLNNKLYCDIHAKLVARQNPPAPNLEPVTVPPGTAPAGTISSALAAVGVNSASSPGGPLSPGGLSPQPGTVGPLPFHAPRVGTSHVSAPKPQTPSSLSGPRPFGSPVSPVSAPAPAPASTYGRPASGYSPSAGFAPSSSFIPSSGFSSGFPSTLSKLRDSAGGCDHRVVWPPEPSPEAQDRHATACPIYVPPCPTTHPELLSPLPYVPAERRVGSAGSAFSVVAKDRSSTPSRKSPGRVSFREDGSCFSPDPPGESLHKKMSLCSREVCDLSARLQTLTAALATQMMVESLSRPSSPVPDQKMSEPVVTALQNIVYGSSDSSTPAPLIRPPERSDTPEVSGLTGKPRCIRGLTPEPRPPTPGQVVVYPPELPPEMSRPGSRFEPAPSPDPEWQSLLVSALTTAPNRPYSPFVTSETKTSAIPPSSCGSKIGCDKPCSEPCGKSSGQTVRSSSSAPCSSQGPDFLNVGSCGNRGSSCQLVEVEDSAKILESVSGRAERMRENSAFMSQEQHSASSRVVQAAVSARSLESRTPQLVVTQDSATRSFDPLQGPIIYRATASPIHMRTFDTELSSEQTVEESKMAAERTVFGLDRAETTVLTKEVTTSHSSPGREFHLCCDQNKSHQSNALQNQCGLTCCGDSCASRSGQPQFCHNQCGRSACNQNQSCVNQCGRNQCCQSASRAAQCGRCCQDQNPNHPCSVQTCCHQPCARSCCTYSKLPSCSRAPTPCCQPAPCCSQANSCCGHRGLTSPPKSQLPMSHQTCAQSDVKQARSSNSVQSEATASVLPSRVMEEPQPAPVISRRVSEPATHWPAPSAPEARDVALPAVTECKASPPPQPKPPGQPQFQPQPQLQPPVFFEDDEPYMPRPPSLQPPEPRPKRSVSPISAAKRCVSPFLADIAVTAIRSHSPVPARDDTPPPPPRQSSRSTAAHMPPPPPPPMPHPLYNTRPPSTEGQRRLEQHKKLQEKINKSPWSPPKRSFPKSEDPEPPLEQSAWTPPGRKMFEKQQQFEQHQQTAPAFKPSQFNRSQKQPEPNTQTAPVGETSKGRAPVQEQVRQVLAPKQQERLQPSRVTMKCQSWEELEEEAEEGGFADVDTIIVCVSPTIVDGRGENLEDIASQALSMLRTATVHEGFESRIMPTSTTQRAPLTSLPHFRGAGDKKPKPGIATALATAPLRPYSPLPTQSAIMRTEPVPLPPETTPWEPPPRGGSPGGGRSPRAVSPFEGAKRCVSPFLRDIAVEAIRSRSPRSQSDDRSRSAEREREKREEERHRRENEERRELEAREKNQRYEEHRKKQEQEQRRIQEERDRKLREKQEHERRQEQEARQREGDERRREEQARRSEEERQQREDTERRRQDQVQEESIKSKNGEHLSMKEALTIAPERPYSPFVILPPPVQFTPRCTAETAPCQPIPIQTFANPVPAPPGDGTGPQRGAQRGPQFSPVDMPKLLKIPHESYSAFRPFPPSRTVECETTEMSMQATTSTTTEMQSTTIERLERRAHSPMRRDFPMYVPPSSPMPMCEMPTCAQSPLPHQEAKKNPLAERPLRSPIAPRYQLQQQQQQNQQSHQQQHHQEQYSDAPSRSACSPVSPACHGRAAPPPSPRTPQPTGVRRTPPPSPRSVGATRPTPTPTGHASPFGRASTVFGHQGLRPAPPAFSHERRGPASDPEPPGRRPQSSIPKQIGQHLPHKPSPLCTPPPTCTLAEPETPPPAACPPAPAPAAAQARCPAPPQSPARPPVPSDLHPGCSLPDAGGPGGVSKGGAFAGASAPIRGRGILNPAAVGSRIPLCGACNQHIRGPFITALGKIWCPHHFVCTNARCGRPLQDIGFVEEKGQLYCEYCFEQFIAPPCNKCAHKIKGDCLNAIGKHFHPECFNCVYCGKLFGNSPFFLEDGQPYCENDWNELFTTKCFACGFPIEAGDRWVEALSNNYHSQCFNCSMCKKNLEGQSFYAKGGRPFCKTHAR